MINVICIGIAMGGSNDDDLKISLTKLFFVTLVWLG